MSIQSIEGEPVPAKLFSKDGDFQRPQSIFRSHISRKAGARFSPEKDRYHLYVSYACPWAHRALIVRKLKGLESIIPITSVHYHMDMVKSWRFVTPSEKIPMEGSQPDPLHPGFERLKELYYAADSTYEGRFTVPVLWDKKLNTVVSNESSEIIRMFYDEFDDLLSKEDRGLDLYPEQLRREIDESNEWMYDKINNGVYKCGLARTQLAYSRAVTDLFLHLDKAESHLSSPSHTGPFYWGEAITETDIRLYVTIVRFDPVYVSLFKTNKRMIRTGYPAMHRWLQNLYWKVPAFHDTTDFEHIKGHYFMSLVVLNPSGIIPEGPEEHVVPLVERNGKT